MLAWFPQCLGLTQVSTLQKALERRVRADDWPDLLPFAFKQTEQIPFSFFVVVVVVVVFFFYCQSCQIAAAGGFQFLPASTPAMCHRPVVSCDAPQRLDEPPGSAKGGQKSSKTRPQGGKSCVLLFAQAVHFHFLTAAFHSPLIRAYLGLKQCSHAIECSDQ